MRKLLVSGFALALLISMVGGAHAVPVLDIGQDNWSVQAMSPSQCSAPAMSMADTPLTPTFMTSSGEEIQSCWCCAKVGDAGCCAACFNQEADK